LLPLFLWNNCAGARLPRLQMGVAFPLSRERRACATIDEVANDEHGVGVVAVALDLDGSADRCSRYRRALRVTILGFPTLDSSLQLSPDTKSVRRSQPTRSSGHKRARRISGFSNARSALLTAWTSCWTNLANRSFCSRQKSTNSSMEFLASNSTISHSLVC